MAPVRPSVVHFARMGAGRREPSVRCGGEQQVGANRRFPEIGLVIEDDAMIGPGAMIQGSRICRGAVTELVVIVCDWNEVCALTGPPGGPAGPGRRSFRGIRVSLLWSYDLPCVLPGERMRATWTC